MNGSESLPVIRTGTYFGECVIHCSETVTVTAEKTSYALTSKVPDPQYPDITMDMETSRKDWEEMKALIDWAKFTTLPSTIGQPDRADQGGEWVEITANEGAKRIDFEIGASVPEIDALLRKVREIRNEISRKYRQ